MNNDDIIATAMLDIATAMQIDKRVPTKYIDALSNAFKSAFSLPVQTCVDVTIQSTGENEWVIVAKSELIRVARTMILPK
jgi:hypothetical protein